MNKIFKITFNDLTVLQLFNSGSVWSIDQFNFLNTQKNYFGVPTIQGVQYLDSYVTINAKISSSGACYI